MVLLDQVEMTSVECAENNKFVLPKEKNGIYLLTKSGTLVGYISSFDVEKGKTKIQKNCFRISPQLFSQVRNYFNKNPEMRNEQLLVLDESNQPRYSIHWQKNTQRIRNNPKGYCADDYWEYDFDNSYCNDIIIDRYDIFVFSKLEEYSHAIALHVLKRRRTSKVYFFDNLAECSELWGGIQR